MIASQWSELAVHDRDNMYMLPSKCFREVFIEACFGEGQRQETRQVKIDLV